MAAAPSSGAAQSSRHSDAEPLLADSEPGLFQRVATELQPPRIWRRWFFRNAADASEQPVVAAPGAAAAQPRDIESGQSQDDVREASAEAQPLVQQPASQQFGTDVVGQLRPEITAAPAIADAAAEAAAAAEEGNAGSPLPIRTPSGSRRTLGERVASLGHLLGLGSKADSSDDGKPEGSKRSTCVGEPRLSRSSSDSQPMCLICLEPLTSEDFISGEAISLDCKCRGELALRHRACAIKWSRVKGDVTCDICKSQVANLPTPSPRASTPGTNDADITIEDYAVEHHAAMSMGLDAVPGNADMLFDCIRVTWIFMIICILFFEMNLSTALWSGIVAGIGYTLFVRALYRQQLAAAQAEAARSAAGGGATPPPAYAQHGPPPMLHHVVG